MGSYKAMYSRKFFNQLDLPPGDGERVVVIERVKQGHLKNRDGEEDAMPFLYFEGETKPFGCNKTNGLTIEEMYGEDPDSWVGKAVTLYRAKVQSAAGTRVDAVRIRSTPPRQIAKAAPAKRKRAAAAA